jgi:D-aminopeptidase
MTRRRFRELGWSVGRFPTGRLNSITDVSGVRVGVSSVLRDAAEKEPSRQMRGLGPSRSGVTAIMPCDDVYNHRLMSGGFVLHGAGELTGLTQILEWGLLETPILLTNTMSVGRAADACVEWMRRRHPTLGDLQDIVIPVVGECDDSFLHDAAAHPLLHEQVGSALTGANAEAVPEGNTGGGTGMITCDLKGGTGSASRVVSVAGRDYTLGVLVQSNFGHLPNLRVLGVPVGKLAEKELNLDPRQRRVDNYGSAIVVLATDAPLWSNQISRLCKRAALAVGNAGSYAAHGSGEIMVGFSTANNVPRGKGAGLAKVELLLDEGLNPLYEAAIEATEEAIYNALCAADTLDGFLGRRVPALPLDWLAEKLARFAPKV